MPRLSTAEREHALGMLAAGASVRATARAHQCHHSTIMRLQRRVQEFGTSADAPRPGQPRVTTRQQDRNIVQRHIQNRFLPAAATGRRTRRRDGEVAVSADTVRRRLREQGLQARRAFVGPVLTPRHREARLLWARQHHRWNRQQWNRVLFSDESRFALFHGDGRHRVWRRQGERLLDGCVQEVDRWGGVNVMVWGGFSFHHRSPLYIFPGNVNAAAYINLLRTHVVPLFRQHPHQLHVLQHDNARSHTARATAEFLEQSGINVLPWPALSPDMAPIEHIWDELGRRISHGRRSPSTRAALQRALIREWNHLPQAMFQHLVTSMRRRCEACIAADGGHTRY